MESMKNIKPRVINISAENTCMLKCKMCYQWKVNKDQREITIEEWKKFISNFKQFTEGEYQINFTGGEALLREGFLNLVYLASKIGYRTALVTNAYLIDEEMARDIAESGLMAIAISLDSLNKETHDFLRGVNGSYERIMRAIGYLRRFSPYPTIDIQTIILDKNLNELIELVEWVQGNNAINCINFQAVVQPFDTPVDNMWYKKDDGILWPKDLGKVYQVLEQLIKLKDRGYKIGNSIAQLKAFEAYFENPDVAVGECDIMDQSIEIDHHGNLRICPLETMGNIRYEDISSILHPDRIALIKRKMASCRNICHFRINCFFEPTDIQRF